MKRLLFAAMLVCIAGVAAACPAAPPPGWSPPRVVSIDVSPVVAGQDFTVTVVAQDDVVVSHLAVAFTVPATVQLDTTYAPHSPTLRCDPVEFEPQMVVTVEFSCSAALNSANGTWIAQVSATDGTQPTGWVGDGAAGFELVGGTDDVTPPTVDSIVAAPDPVPVGSPVVVTVRLSDEHAIDVPRPLRFVRELDAAVVCTETSRKQLSPTQIELVHTCPAPVATGTAQAFMVVRDVVGNTTMAHRWVTITES